MVGQYRSRIYRAGTIALGLGLACAHNPPPPTIQETVTSDVAVFQKRVHDVVKDPARVERLVDLSSDYLQLVLERAASVKAYKGSLETLNARYAATRAEFETLFGQQTADRAAFSTKIIALRGQIAAACTDAEWEELKSTRMEALDTVLEVQ